MSVSRAVALVSLLALSPVLAGCGVAELVAHGVKAVEKRNQPPAGEATASQSPTQQTTQADEPPPPARAPSSQRSSVTVEELPAR